MGECNIVRTRIAAVVIAVLTLAGFLATSRADASAGDEYTGTHFGAGNVPPGCEADSLVTYEDNVCYHQRTGMNGLDDPKVDVVIMVPETATAERDARIMRQAVQMWDGGIQNLGPQQGLDWLSTGMRFNIHVAIIGAADQAGFNPYPVADPEIVVLATHNPFGGLGIGIDPVDSAGDLVEILDPTRPIGEVPCSGLQNPFDMEAWQSVPGFDAHHGETSGTYTQDCKGVGGNICFAINTALDPAPDTIELVSLFDMVAHEFGHCLSIGHVGDGAEGPWGKVPTNDIMSYNADPVDLNKCVSTLDLESIAVSMSKYIDANGDGAVTPADKLDANDQTGDGSDAFQTQHPRDHYYASSTGSPRDCPQPNLSLIPGAEPNWNPATVTTARNVLTVTSPVNDATTPDGNVTVTGIVEHQRVDPADPTSSTASYDDADDDASTPITEITHFTASTTDDTVEATIALDSLPPIGDAVTSPTTYSLTIDNRRFDSFVLTTGADTWDNVASAYLDSGTSTWDTATNKVAFHIPRSYLADFGITAPYQVRADSFIGNAATMKRDDSAPDGRETVGIAAPAASAARAPTIHVPVVGRHAQTVSFHHEGGNTFYADQSQAGVIDLVNDQSHMFALDLPQASDVTFNLSWTDPNGGSDLDLTATNAGITNTDAATSANPETATLHGVRGRVDLKVSPFLVTDEIDGVTYTLTADVTALEGGGGGDDDPPVTTAESVRVLVDGVVKGSTEVDTSSGPDQFSIPVTIGTGTHKVRTEWMRFGQVAKSETRSVTFGAPTTDPVVLPKLSIDDATITEGPRGTKAMAFTVHLDRPAASDLQLTLSTTDGTATSPQDFESGISTFVIAAGQTIATPSVMIRGDVTQEPTESFSVTVSGTGVTYADATATGTILDDDTNFCLTLGYGNIACASVSRVVEVPLP